MKWKEGLRKWREQRGLTEPQTQAIVKMITEELDELGQGIESSNEHEIIDALADIIVLSANHIGQMGYDLDLVMKEVVKEISSRQQDPEQADRWAKGNKRPDEKWKKDTSEEAKSKWYVADFSTCKTNTRVQ